MKEIVLTPKDMPTIGLEAEVITPEGFAGKTLEEIGRLKAYEGNVERSLNEYFEIHGNPGASASETRIIIDGDASKVKRIGQEMREGEIIIKGDAGMHLGSKMKGGRIVVGGDVDAFGFQEMRGGEAIIKGSAGNYLGSALRGDWRGMRGGSITVEGNAGSEIATFMRGGRIQIKGNAGPFAGVHMQKGLIIIGGVAAKRVGADMLGGTIVAEKTEPLLPGFRLEGDKKNPQVEEESFQGVYAKYSGDHADSRAKGELYIRK